MPQGTVKFFNAAKGFGFITPDGGGKDVFVPTASSGSLPGLKPGQRVTFDTQPDAKGPKAVNLVLLPTPAAPPRPEKPAARITIYCDPDTDIAEDVLEEVRHAGQEPVVVNVIAAPPTRDELKKLSALVKANEQSLVKKYDPLFHSLQLDDRFLSENEFWDGVVEHPSLLDGPVLTNGGKARICRSGADVKAFFSDAPVATASAKPKTLSPRLLMLMSGQSVPPLPPKPKVAEIVEAPKKTPVEAPEKIKLAPRATTAKKPAAKPKLEAKPKAAAKPAAKKAVKAAKPAAAKKKAKR